ncbi:hypothetical protein [Thiorhodococcus minor]|uniref:Uncharacterized protein n=1 Tax=Thiorhodococcus minor TaxID=57489 RepID=A0A6M0K4B6_9GAMM|nr:hypothetical protein [Thiorhodococcus minor]NEV64622.1 hypothetical protein [Thiorhodococcus minor]
MNELTKITTAALAALILPACATNETMSGSSVAMSRQASGAAESACMSAVNSNYGGKVREVRVASSELSEANSSVMVDAVGVRGGPTTERWRCLVSNDGNVEELSVVQ